MSAENPQSIREVISQFVTQERDFRRDLHDAYVANFDDLAAHINRHKKRADVCVDKDKYRREPDYITVKAVAYQELKERLGNNPFLTIFDDDSLLEIQMSRYGQIQVIDRERKIAQRVTINFDSIDVHYGLFPHYTESSELIPRHIDRAFLVRDLAEAADKIISERLTPQPVSQ